MIIKIKDIKINYEVYGNGKEIVLLHGWGQSINTFNSLVDELKNTFKVYVIDLPGFGQSEILRAISVRENAFVLRELFSKLNINKPIIVAHSYGGRIAVILESICDIEKLILVGVPLIKEKLSFKKKTSVWVYKFLKKLSIKVNWGSSDYKNASPILKQMLVMAINYDLSDYLVSIKCPTLLMYGKHDSITTVKMAKAASNLINNSGLVEIPNSGHFCYLENKPYFLIVLNEFIGGPYVNA